MSNLSEEEQKAIENLKKDFILMNNGEYAITDDYILYNYISKLQEENEKLKGIYSKTNLEKTTREIFNKTLKEYVSKDKIKELEYDLNKMEKQEQFKVKIYSPIDIIKAQILELVEILEDSLKEE